MFCKELSILTSIGFCLFGIFWCTDSQGRKYLADGHRGKIDLAFAEISCLAVLGHRVEPNAHAAPAREKDVRADLVDIPEALESSRQSRSGIPGVIRPGRDMADWVIAKGAIYWPPFFLCEGDRGGPPQGASIRALFSSESRYFSLTDPHILSPRRAALLEISVATSSP